MEKKIKVGSIVKFNKNFLATLTPQDRANERRRKYTVTALRPWSDGTIMVDLQTARIKTGTTIGWLEVAE